MKHQWFILSVMFVVSTTMGELKRDLSAPPPQTPAPVLYDTTTAVLTSANAKLMLPEKSWSEIQKGQLPSKFQGDAVLVNSKVAVVVGKDGSGVGLYARDKDSWTRYAHLVPVIKNTPLRLTGIKAVTNTEELVVIEAGSGEHAVWFSLSGAEPIVKTTPKGKVEALRITTLCRLCVFPDFFADDLLLDAREIPVDHTEIPGGNIQLCMVSTGNVIVAVLRDRNEQDIEANLSGSGTERLFGSFNVPFGTGGSVWTAVLVQDGIWYAREFTKGEIQAGVRLEDWAIPFLANWKGNFMREDKNSESIAFSLSIKGRGGTSDKTGIEKKGGRLTAVVSDSLREMLEFGAESPTSGKEYTAKYVGLQGVGVIYPLSRTQDTPLTQLCVADLMRMALGTGPCESILDLDSRQPVSKGIFTCSYGGMWQRLLPFEPPYLAAEYAKRIKEQRYFFRRVNRNVMTFVKNVQDRINTYVEFGLRMLAYLDEQEKKHPEQAEFIGKVKAEWARPVWQYGKPYANTEKCNNEAIALPLVEEFNKATRIDTPEQAMKARGAAQLPNLVGDPGDRRLANLRRKVMLIRAMATMEIARNPAVSETAKKIRAMADEALRNPHSYERVTVW
jgi:hypothetical protein